MSWRINHLLSIAFVAVAAAGCGASAPSRFYTLSSTATSNDVTTAKYAVLVGPVSVPAAVDRPQFVVQVAPNRVELDEFNRWAAPLNDAIARAVAGNLAAARCSARMRSRAAARPTTTPSSSPTTGRYWP
jgi:hypothetical protein